MHSLVSVDGDRADVDGCSARQRVVACKMNSQNVDQSARYSFPLKVR